MPLDLESNSELRFESALVYLTRIHEAHQSPAPLAHRLACASIVMDDKGSIHEALAALLGPLPRLFPRAGKTLDEIQTLFGQPTAHLVLALSGLDSASYALSLKTILENIPPLISLDAVARLIAADRLAQLRSYSHKIHQNIITSARVQTSESSIARQTRSRLLKDEIKMLLTALPYSALTEEIRVVSQSIWGRNYLS